MWTLLTGYLLSTFFKNQTIELFGNKFSNETLSFWGILLGWLFQEYTREEFEFTGGKRFMVESDFRNRLFTQSFKITRNLIMYPHIITTLELGTFLLLFGFFFTILIKIYLPKLKKSLTELLNTKDYESFLYKNYLLVYRNQKFKFSNLALFFSLVFIFKQGFFKIYFWYDTFFIFRPIFFILLVIFELFSFLFFYYLIYTYMIYTSKLKIALILKTLTTKWTIYFIIIGFCLLLFFYDLTVQNITTENFLKEIFFKSFFIFYPLICLKQN